MVPTETQSNDLLEAFKEEFDAYEAVDLVNHETGAWINEDETIACVPSEECRFGVLHFDDLQSPRKFGGEEVTINDKDFEATYFERNGTRHHVQKEYVVRLLDLIDEQPTELLELARSNFGYGTCYPVVIETGKEYNFTIAPISV